MALRPPAAPSCALHHAHDLGIHPHPEPRWTRADANGRTYDALSGKRQGNCAAGSSPHPEQRQAMPFRRAPRGSRILPQLEEESSAERKELDGQCDDARGSTREMPMSDIQARLIMLAEVRKCATSMHFSRSHTSIRTNYGVDTLDLESSPVLHHPSPVWSVHSLVLIWLAAAPGNCATRHGAAMERSTIPNGLVASKRPSAVKARRTSRNWGDREQIRDGGG
jgi:hypothetical protein